MPAKFAKTFAIAIVALFMFAAPVLAADAGTEAQYSSFGWGYLAAGIAAGLATIGGAYGIGKLAAQAMEGTARQPEAAGDIRTTMIIAAALIEGFTFFAIIVALQLAGLKVG
ncbi:MAG: F-type H+-transporting ATPase subunit c [Planctomycetota bacterium]|jgi:F-type H+-transporting ATPase subunit c